MTGKEGERDERQGKERERGLSGEAHKTDNEMEKRKLTT